MNKEWKYKEKVIIPAGSWVITLRRERRLNRYAMRYNHLNGRKILQYPVRDSRSVVSQYYYTAHRNNGIYFPCKDYLCKKRRAKEPVFSVAPTTPLGSLVQTEKEALIGREIPDKRFSQTSRPLLLETFSSVLLKYRLWTKVVKKKSSVKKITQFEIICPQVAGIDVSDNAGMMVAYPINEKEIVVEEFECYTGDLHRLSCTLKEYHIESVAMEATGVYWIALFILLQEDGFEVYLVNSKHVKNVTGRKNDEGDAEWIQKLHRCGLLSVSFQPDNQTRALRSVMRHRSDLVETRTCYLNRMQKALEQMNIKLHTVISDIDGKTGLSILHAIFEGERDAEKLANLCDPRIKASRKEIVKSLEGFWSETYLFELRQCYKAFQFHNDTIEECDRELEKNLLEMIAAKNDRIVPNIESVKRKRNYKRSIQINVTAYLKELNGIDITEITGISEINALRIFSETGTDMSRWKTEKHFTSWLGLAPNTKISGGKVISSHVPQKNIMRVMHSVWQL